MEKMREEHFYFVDFCPDNGASSSSAWIGRKTDWRTGEDLCFELNDIQEEEEEKTELEKEKMEEEGTGVRWWGIIIYSKTIIYIVMSFLKVTFVGVRRLEIDITG